MIANKMPKKQMIILLIIVSLIAFILVLNKVNNRNSFSVTSHSTTKEAIGTIITIHLYDTKEHPMTENELQNISNQLFAEVNRLELIFSAKLEDSELSHLNNTAYNSPIKVSDELFEIIETSIIYYELSNYAFDISLGNLISLWNIGSDEYYLPTESEVEKYINKFNVKNIVMDKENKTIMYSSPDINIDLGAIAKGYIGEKIAEMAKKLNVHCGILSFGGNIVTIGERYNNEAWTIGITDPMDTSKIASYIEVTDKSIVTSGNYERYFVKNNVRYHHILDPSTGFPAQSGIISSTIIGDSSTICDILSTTCFIIGLEDATKLIESLDGIEAIFIDANGTTHTTSRIDKYNFIINN